MAYALPSVAFDLTETRVSGGDTVLYVPSGDVHGFADAVEKLLDDDVLRCEMGRAARLRVSAELDWRQQAVKYADVFHRLTGHGLAAEAACTAQAYIEPEAGVDPQGRRYVDLNDAAELQQFMQRSAL
jgi:hypothetical protein